MSVRTATKRLIERVTSKPIKEFVQGFPPKRRWDEETNPQAKKQKLMTEAEIIEYEVC